MPEKKIIIDDKNKNLRIDSVCAKMFPKISRTMWQKHGVFFCDGQKKNYKTLTKKNQKWIIDYKCNEQENNLNDAKPWNFSLDILAETDNYLVINKLYGISVHNSATEKTDHTIVNALIYYFQNQKEKNNLSHAYDIIDNQKIYRPGIVHRLDKTTSGVLLIAKNDQTHFFLQKNWDKTEKIYYAVVTGTPPKKGKILGPIKRDLKNRKKMMISADQDAKKSETIFETIKTNKKFSLLKIQPLTGRTHQIRVHLSSIGCPILGDKLYGGENAEKIFLHAYSLKFPQLDEKNNIIFKTVLAKLPENFHNLQIKNCYNYSK